MRDSRVLIGLSTLVALGAGTATFFLPHSIRLAGVGIGDIGLPLAGMNSYLKHISPYDVQLGAGGVALYPFTTMLLLSWLLLVPLRLVAAVFCGVSSFFLAFAVLREEPWWRMLLFASPPFWAALRSVQWSPLFTAALLLPALLPVAVAKPHLGILLAAAGRWSWRTITTAVLIVTVSLVLFPRWPMEWIVKGHLSTFNGRVPLLVIPGFLLIASALCWRTARGRRLIAMSVCFQRYFYDQLPLFLQPASLRQMLILIASSWASVILSVAARWTDIDGVEQNGRTWMAIIIGTYLPALVMTIWNERHAEQIAEPDKAPRPSSRVDAAGSE